MTDAASGQNNTAPKHPNTLRCVQEALAEVRSGTGRRSQKGLIPLAFPHNQRNVILLRARAEPLNFLQNSRQAPPALADSDSAAVTQSISVAGWEGFGKGQIAGPYFGSEMVTK